MWTGGHIDPADEYIEHLQDVGHRFRQARVLVGEVRTEQGAVVAGSVVLTLPGMPMSETSLEGELEFRMLAVDPRVQRRGVARALVRAAIDRAEQLEGVHAVVLTTMVTMTGAHRLYESEGFTRVPERDWRLSDIGQEPTGGEDQVFSGLPAAAALNPAPESVQPDPPTKLGEKNHPSRLNRRRFMSAITREDVAHLARLAHIRMDENELATMAGELDVIMDAIASVGEVAGQDVPPTSHPIPLRNVFREDVPSGMLTQEQALAMAPDAEDGQFKVPAILDGE